MLASQPPPELRRRLETTDRVVVVVGHREALAPAQRAEARLALLEHVPGADAAALDPRDEIGPQAHREAGPGRVDGVALLVGELPVRRCAPVVEHGLADELDLHAAVDAADGAHEEVPGVLVGGRPGVRGDHVVVPAGAQDEGVAHDRPAGLRVPRRDDACSCPARSDARRAPGARTGASRKLPASRSSRLPNTLGESKRGAQSQSIDPSGATSAPVWQSERNA